MRRPFAGAGRRSGFRGLGGSTGGGVPAVQYVGVQLTSTSQYIAGGASQFNSAILHMRAWLSLDAKSASATKNIVGTSNFGAAGVGVIGESQGGVTTPDRCRVIGFADSKYSSTSSLNYHVPCDTEFGWLQVHDVWITGTTLYHAINGCVVGVGTASTATTLATTNQLAINGRVTAPSTLGYGAMTIVGVQFSTTAPSAGVIAAAYSASPETALSGCVRHFCASDLGSAGAPAGTTWVDRISGSVTLTITGSPSLVAKEAPRVPVGVIEIYGDSIAVGRRNASSPYDSDVGWRGPSLDAFGTAGRFAAYVGQSVSADLTSLGVGTPKVYDRRMSAVAGQALGVTAGPASKLSTIAADLPTYSHTTSPIIVAYGINDLSYRCGTLAQSAADASAAFLADLDTCCAAIRANRSARIFIQDILLAGTGGSGITATVQAAIDLVNAALPSTIASLNGTYGSVSLLAASPAVTPNQAAADDVAVLYDKIHETDASKTVHGAAIAAQVLAA